MPDNGGKPIKVAVLGSGAGAMAAVFELMSKPDARSRYDVTVYQQGWRIGGKCASGRNQALGDRIEEHGLHMLMGFYESAFRIMREAYAERAPDPANPFQTWRDAFTPQWLVSFGDRRSGGLWNITFPRLPGEPGDPVTLDDHDLAVQLLDFIDDHLRNAPPLPGVAARLATLPVRRRLAAFRKRARSTSASEARGTALTGELDELLGALRSWLADLFRLLLGFSEAAQHWWIILDLAVAMLGGLWKDIIWGPGFDALNDRDFRDWLREHGALQEALLSAPITGLYDLIFAYVDGDRNRPAVEAGTMLKTVLRMVFTYREAPLWKMNAGMGDTIFSPLYEVLKARGVKFNFFHRIEELHLDPTGRKIARIRGIRQAALKSGDPSGYAPLVTVLGLPCWPSATQWDQLVDGTTLEQEGVNFESAWCHRSVGDFTLDETDFDVVILGIPVGALPPLTRELERASAPWHDMLERLRTVQTQATQLWFTPTTTGLGWTYGPTVLAGSVPLIGSWGDMSHLIPRENWPAGTPVGSIAYLCGVLPDAPEEAVAQRDFPGRAQSWAEGNAQQWVNDNSGSMWPASVTPQNTFDARLLARIGGGPELRRWSAQYFRANVDPTERYVLSVPGSSRFRLAPGASGFDNLYLAGDWTQSSINGGSVEAAFESGVACGRALLARGPG